MSEAVEIEKVSHLKKYCYCIIRRCNLFKNKNKEWRLTARGRHIVIDCSSHIATTCHVAARSLVILGQYWCYSDNSSCSSHYTKCCNNRNCHKQYFCIHIHQTVKNVKIYKNMQEALHISVEMSESKRRIILSICYHVSTDNK